MSYIDVENIWKLQQDCEEIQKALADPQKAQQYTKQQYGPHKLQVMEVRINGMEVHRIYVPKCFSEMRDSVLT